MESLPNTNYNYDGERRRVSDTESTATQLPAWLRTALEDDDIVQNHKNNLPIQPRRKSIQNGDFLFHSDNESIQVPRQVSRGRQGRQFRTISNGTFLNNFDTPASDPAIEYMRQFIHENRNTVQRQKSNHMQYPF